MLDPIEFIRMVRDGKLHHKNHPDEPCLCSEDAATNFIVEWEAAQQNAQIETINTEKKLTFKLVVYSNCGNTCEMAMNFETQQELKDALDKYFPSEE